MLAFTAYKKRALAPEVFTSAAKAIFLMGGYCRAEALLHPFD
jgi:hypothetical protein